jgi:signal transduction histidine kinase
MPPNRPRLATTPPTPTSVRVLAVVIAVAGVAVAARATLTSTAWVGRVFPGFVMLDNRVIASVGLAHWTGTAVPDLYQNEVLAVGDRAIGSTPEAYAAVATYEPGRPVTYRLRRGDGSERTVTVAAQRFATRDWILLYGMYLLNGIVFLAASLATFVLRPDLPAARGFLAGGAAVGFFLFTAMDLYGPAAFFRLHVLAESALPAGMLHFALMFPERNRWSGLRVGGWAIAGTIAALYEIFLYSPAQYSRILTTNMLYLAVVAVFFCANLVVAYGRGDSQLVRQRVRILLIGALFGFALPAVVLALAAAMAGDVSMNLAATTPFMFGIALAYAIVQHDLFDIDAMVKRGAYYLVLTGAVSAAYLAAVLAFNFVLRTGAVTDSGAFPVVFALAVLLLFNPLRTRVQSFVDRVFFGTTYDGGKVLTEIGTELAHARQRDEIARIIATCLQRTIPNEGTRLFVAGLDPRGLAALDGRALIAADVAARFANGRVVTVVDAPESDADPALHAATRAALHTIDATIVVPMVAHGELMGALALGAKRSGFFYTAGDADLLRALGRETAVALQHAAGYERIVELNANLETVIRERTAQLETANAELGETLRELQAAESQLVHSEKMASLGRLVAGVAHEINNPVSFIANSVTPLRRRLAKAASAEPGAAVAILKEAEELVEIMANGAARAAAIVKDLRSFSRLDEATRKSVDLHEGLDVSLRLLEHRWRGCIQVRREYGALPLVDCDPGQINQVFVNVIANACDAMKDGGTLTVTTSADADRVRVDIADDGAGIPPDARARIFDPFFTTKDVGEGTGLGLSISHGIIAAHGGRIDVASAPGRGATFTIVLPAHAAAIDTKVARGGR